MPATSVEPKQCNMPFANRLQQAADMNPHCPSPQHGRLRWVKDQLEAKGKKTTTESVRKWFAGIVQPGDLTMHDALAEVFGVDPVWLRMGIDAKMAPRDQRVRNALASGVVNVVAGLIQMDGGTPAFPPEDDQRARRDSVDLYAIIKGASYSFHVALGAAEDETAIFHVPAQHDAIIVLGVIRDENAFDIFELSDDVIEQYGTKHGGSIEVRVPGGALRRIQNFSSRL